MVVTDRKRWFLEYSRFCDLYRLWSGKLEVCLRQEHKAGERLFVDYAGETVEIVDPETGLIRTAQIFVAVLGASNYTLAQWYRSCHEPPSGGQEFQRPSNRIPATRV